MKLVYIGLIGAILGCSPEDQKEIQSLKGIYSRNAPELIWSFERLKSGVEDQGNRTKDVALLKKAEALIAARRQTGIFYGEAALDSILVFQNLDPLIDTLANHVKWLEDLPEIREPFLLARIFLQRYRKNENYKDYLQLRLNMQAVEYEILERFRRSIGVFDTFSFTHLTSNDDTAYVGSPLRLIVNLDCYHRYLESWEINIDSLVLEKGGTQIPKYFLFERIGPAGYLSFVPKQPGNYRFSGNYTLYYPPENFENKQRFSKSFVVLE